MYAPIATVPETNAQALYEELLRLNFCCVETNGATFALDEDGRRICLCYVQSIDSADELSFENLVGNFLETAKKWHEHFNAPVGESAHEKETPSIMNPDMRV